ncbi:MAG: hypothetical protein HY420_00290 [Candidatus Kerfeldbacteria bacterium]|nr:hypothetical protein [Candidatus Kerfeldbacteria bacterium]
MTQPLTKADLKAAIVKLSTKDDLTDAVHTLTASMNSRFTKIDQTLTEAHTKLDAIMSLDVIATRKQLLILMRALKAKGIDLDEAEILAA